MQLPTAYRRHRVWLSIMIAGGGASLLTIGGSTGTAEAPVVWRAWQDETVRLLGGRTLSGFQPVTDPAVLNRLQEKARGDVRQIDLRALGIHEYGAKQEADTY